MRRPLLAAVALLLLAAASPLAAAREDDDEEYYILSLKPGAGARRARLPPAAPPRRFHGGNGDEDDAIMDDVSRCDPLALEDERGFFPIARVLRRAVRGAVLRLDSPAAAALRARLDPDCALEVDARVTAQGYRTTKVVAQQRSRGGGAEAFRPPRPTHWELDRVDQRALPLDGVASAVNASSSGEGTIVYVVDSGVMRGHDEFRRVAETRRDDESEEQVYYDASAAAYAAAAFDAAASPSSRVVAAADFVSGESPSDKARVAAIGGDCYGHGTAVASLAAGVRSGLAPRADVVDVRVLDCAGNGRVSDVISGLDYAIEHYRSLPAYELPPAALTLSLGVPIGVPSRALERAVAEVVRRHNVVVVVAAGNAERSRRTSDACRFSPGREPSVITVAASEINDRTWSDGMTGPCVDLFAPGVEVTAAAFEEDVGNRYSYQLNARFGRDDDDGGDDDDDGAETEMETDAYAGWTGTSMAAPIVAGAALARMSLERGEGADGAPNPDASGAFLQTCFTHRPVSTLDRVSFRLTGELFLYGTTLRREAAAARRSHGECAVGQARPAGRRTFRFVFHPPRTF